MTRELEAQCKQFLQDWGEQPASRNSDISRLEILTKMSQRGIFCLTSRADSIHISSIILVNLDKLEKSLHLSLIQDKTRLRNLKYCLSYSSCEVESFSTIFYKFTKGVLLYLHAGGKDTIKLYTKDPFLINPYLLDPRIFKLNLDFMKFSGSSGEFLTILCRINMFPCFIILSFQWIQRAETENKKFKKKKSWSVR